MGKHVDGLPIAEHDLVERKDGLLKAIAAAYSVGGLVVTDRLPGDGIRQEIGDNAENCTIGIYFSLLNEIILLSRYRSYYYMAAISSNKEAIIDYNFAVRATRAAGAIRVLCGRGLDVDARMLLRNIYELSLLRCRILLYPDLREEYVASESSRSANEFWHKHIKGGRLRASVERKARELGIPWLGLVNDGENLDQIEKICGLTSHPTWIAKSIDSAGDFKDVDGFILSKPSINSRFTLKNLILCMCLPGIFEREMGPTYDPPDLIESLNPYPKPITAMTWTKYVRSFPTIEFGLSILAMAPKQSDNIPQ